MEDQQLNRIPQCINITVKPHPHPILLYVCVCTSPLNMMKKLPPSGDSFARPYPETACNPDDHCHQILDHEYLEIWFPTQIFSSVASWTRDRVDSLMAHLPVPREHPVIEVRRLVEEASDDNEGWNCVQDREYSYANHEFFQLIGFRSVVFHDGTYAE